MLSNYKKMPVLLDKDMFEFPIGWWNKELEDVATYSFVENGNIAVGGLCDVSKKEFIRSMLFSVVSNYKSDEILISIIDKGNESYDDFNILSNVSISYDDNSISKMLNELLLDIDKRLCLLGKESLKTYNQSSPIKFPFRLVVLPDVSNLVNSDFLKETYLKLIDMDNRESKTLSDRAYVSDSLRNCDRAGVYIVSVLDNKTYDFLKSSKVAYTGLDTLVRRSKIGFRWGILGLSDVYKRVGKGVIVTLDEEPYNFYSNTITRVDLINKLRCEVCK